MYHTFTGKDFFIDKINGDAKLMSGRQLRRYFNKKKKKTKFAEAPYTIRNLLLKNNWL